MLACNNLKTERQRAPRGLVVDTPALSWTLSADRNQEQQSACEVEVERITADGSRSRVWC